MAERFTTAEAILGAFASLDSVLSGDAAGPDCCQVDCLSAATGRGLIRSGAGSISAGGWPRRSKRAVPVGYLAGTPLYNIYLRLMGAKIGRNAYLGCDAFASYDLLDIGDDSSINVDSNLPGYTVENGWLKIGRVTIGRRCFVGARAAVGLDTVMEDDSALEDLSLLPRGGVIPRGQTGCGSPARPTRGRRPRRRASPRRGPPVRFRSSAWHWAR